MNQTAPPGYALVSYEQFEKLLDAVGKVQGIRNRETKEMALKILEEIDLGSNF